MISQGKILRVNVGTADVLGEGGVQLRNVAVAEPLTIENLLANQIVTLFWDTSNTPHITSIIGFENQKRDKYIDTEPPPKPKNVRVEQCMGVPRLRWDWGGTQNQRSDFASYIVDAKQSGGNWGFDVYPTPSGTEVHYAHVHVPIYCRVCAEDRRGNRSAWEECRNVLVDTSPPIAPYGLRVSSETGGVRVKWTGPGQGTNTDLAGFHLYQATASDGTGAILVKTVGPTTSTFHEAYVGKTFYYNLTAFDYAGNESVYAVDAWLEGTALIGQGIQLLTNCDFERDRDADGNADGWLTTAAAGSSLSLGAYGMGGGQGYRASVVTYDPGTPFSGWVGNSYMYFMSGGQNQKIPAIAGGTYTWSVCFKTSETALLFIPLEGGVVGSEQPSDYLNIVPQPIIGLEDGTGYISLVNSGMKSGWIAEELDDGWVRVALEYTIQPGDIGVGYKWLGIGIYVVNTLGYTATVDLDRAQMEMGKLSPWKPGVNAPYGTSAFGLLIDNAGIKTSDGTFWLADDGLFYSNLERSTAGTRDIGTAGTPWDTVYCVDLVADTISGETMSGAEWEHSDDMIIDAHKLAGHSTVYVVNQDVTYRADLNVDRDIIVGGTVDGVDIAAFYTGALMADGSKELTGDLTVTATKTIDGVDISTHDHTGVAGHGATVAHGSLTGVSSDQHHAKLHTMLDTDHHSYSGGAALDVFGLSAASTLAKITPSSNPGAAPAILRTDDNGLLQVIGLGIGATPVAAKIVMLDTGELVMDDATLKRTAANSLGPATGDSLASSNYAAGVAGWAITASGNAEFANARIRGELISTVLKFNELQATAGTLGVFPSASTLYADCTTVNSPATFTLKAKNSEDGAPLFILGDYLQIKSWQGSSVYENWLHITNYGTDYGTYKEYTCVKDSGTACTFKAGTAVACWSNPTRQNGAILLSADEGCGYSPNISIITYATYPWTQTLVGRFGNIRGCYGMDPDVDAYGIGIGDSSGDSDANYLVYDPDNGFRLHAGGGQIILDDDGICIATPALQLDLNAYAFKSGSTITGALYGWVSASNYNEVDLVVKELSAKHSYLKHIAHAGVDKTATVELHAYGDSDDMIASLTVHADGTDRYVQLGTNTEFRGSAAQTIFIGDVHIQGVSKDLDVSGNVEVFGALLAWGGIQSLGNMISATLEIDDYITALGGIHVGGTSDPGTDNLIVDGYATVNGGIHVGGTSDPGDDNLIVDGFLILNQGAQQTITDDTITAPSSYFRVETAGGADNLHTINGYTDGMYIRFHITTNANPVTLKHNDTPGNILCHGKADFTLDHIRDYAEGWYDSARGRWMLRQGDYA